MSGPNQKRLGTIRRAFFGTRSRVTTFLLEVGKTRVTPKFRLWRWLTAAILLLFALEMGTGILLSLYYYPEPDSAYESMRLLMAEVPNGWLVRSFHHWAGELALALVLAHLLVVFFRRAYTRPHEYSWVVGIFLLLLFLGLRFTGRLLPWDNFGIEVTRHGLALLDQVPLLGGFMSRWLKGGEELGPNTLSRFFTTHVLILPWLVALFAGFHLWLVRRQGLKGDES